ncbi:hypothetical protein FRB90_009772, partial [Tulasnella sp. 427]
MQTSSGFDDTQNPSTSPSAGKNQDVARMNAFYITNKVHDTFYKYGFTEKAFNFQDDNHGKGVKKGDRAEMQVQASGTNNANFTTPPDGQSGHCNMYTWTYTTPNRDGDLENDIITHELTHGLTNRLAGGGTGSYLQTTKAGGMGEGWSDTVAFWSEQNSTTVKPFALGSWVTSTPKGIRSVHYSPDKSVDPLMYSDRKTRTEVHDIGELWATMLVQVYSALVGACGFAPDRSDPNETQGKVVFMQLLVNALALQSCNPTFLTAR